MSNLMLEVKGKKNLPPGVMAHILAKIKATQNKELRTKMLMAIAKIREPWVLPILLEALADPSEGVREKIINQLINRDDLAYEDLSLRLKNQPWFVKVAVLKILGLKKERRAIEKLVKILDDPNIEVRRHLAICLGQIGAKEGVPLLVKLLRDSSRYVRLAAEEAMRQISRLRFT
ncbi:MAG: HEAT repeat domain-containing protein [Candidatus Aminicenantes bacterium]|nr:HEAT repeat domain-containing protein [Candidatus Aminicenantes bacterium]